MSLCACWLFDFSFGVMASSSLNGLWLLHISDHNPSPLVSSGVKLCEQMNAFRHLEAIPKDKTDSFSSTILSLDILAHFFKFFSSYQTKKQCVFDVTLKYIHGHTCVC